MNAHRAEAGVNEDWAELDILDDYLPSSSGSSAQDSGSAHKCSARKTREELNMIEKQRTRRINQQIQSLRMLLETSGLTTKKDKFSILHHTAEYIQRLQQSLAASELKNQELQRTLATTQAEVADPTADQALAGASCRFDSAQCAMLPPPAAIIPSDIDLASYDKADYASNVDYQTLFLNASIAMAVANVDGQFMDCNLLFSQISGFSREDIRRVSMFNLTPPEEMNHLFTIVGGMLSERCDSGKYFWKRCRFQRGESHCFVSMWLVRRPTGEPAYFQCAIVPLEDIPSTVVPNATGVNIPPRGPTEADLRLTLPGK